MKKINCLLALVFLFISSGCEAVSVGILDTSGGGDLDADADGDTDTNGDTDTDIDTDTDGDGDSDTDTDGDSDSDTDGDIDTDSDIDTGTEYTDQDGDGWIEGIDCDDENPNVNQGTEEIYDPPNGIDDDCDGLTDEEETDPPEEVFLSYIWISNSIEGTVSKIDTRELTEVGRYRVHPEGNGSPSRTSVNGNSDMVVASREPGAVTMIRGNTDTCVESNGIPGIQTSSGPSDILDWDTEECRGWHQDFSWSDDVRAIAWTPGTYNTSTQLWENPKVWVGASLSSVNGSAVVYLLNGDDGTIENSAALTDINTTGFGRLLYGAVVDAQSNMWITQLGSTIGEPAGVLIKVDFNTLDYETWDQPAASYGITIDAEGRIWTCSRKAARFDPVGETWEVSDFIDPVSVTGGFTGGCMTDGQGTLWIPQHFKLFALDTNTLETLDSIDVPADSNHWGLALDVDGYVWSVPVQGTKAYRTNPADHTYDIVDGLNGAYTYSDMTGFLLHMVSPDVT